MENKFASAEKIDKHFDYIQGVEQRAINLSRAIAISCFRNQSEFGAGFFEQDPGSDQTELKQFAESIVKKVDEKTRDFHQLNVKNHKKMKKNFDYEKMLKKIHEARHESFLRQEKYLKGAARADHIQKKKAIMHAEQSEISTYATQNGNKNSKPLKEIMKSLSFR
ncbi:MAG: hypothetical protein MHMPM18_000969 [Marteilia pararefringens]